MAYLLTDLAAGAAAGIVGGMALGLAGDNTEYPLEAHLRGLAAHVVFGVVTAGLLKASGFARDDEQ